MSRIVVISRVPGFRRAGIAHPARKVYEPGELTTEQLVALRAEPNLTVVEVTEGGEVDGRYALTELRAAVGAAMEAGVSLASFTVAIADFIAREWNAQQGASGTAREAPSAGSGSDAAASDGVQPTPPHDSEAPQQAQDASGQQAEPEAELADKVGEEAAQESTSGVTPGLSAPETGEAEGDGAAAAAPAADKPAKPARKPK